jgi:glycosyltransferase involved in cell wall biosynthesis
MIIVHVLNSLVIGGVEKVVVDICNTIDSEKNQVYIVNLSNIDLKLKSMLNKNIEVINLPYKNDSALSILLFWIFGIPKMIRVINKLNPKIIHSHLYFHYFLFLSLSIKLSIISPVHFRTIHTSGLFYSSKTFVNRFRLFIEKIGSKIYPIYLISISQQIHENNKSFFSKYAAKIRLIPNGINLIKFTKSIFATATKSDFGIDNRNIIVVYVARLNYGKNHSCLLKAWAEVIKNYNNANLCIVGDGVLKDVLVKQSEDLKIEKSVSFFGNLDNVSGFLSVADIGVFPSQFEGFPISLIEKMAMGLAVVTSDINVFKEIIEDDVNGVIYSVNDFHSLAEHIIMLLKDDEMRIRLGKKAQETASKYDINRIVIEINNFYEETLSV